MVIGALLGAGIWRLLEPIAPGVPADPSPFVIVAMMALFGSVARAPLAVMLMVAEMTDSLAMLAPAMLAIGIATLIVGDRTDLRVPAPKPRGVAGAPVPLRAAAHGVDPGRRRGSDGAGRPRSESHRRRRAGPTRNCGRAGRAGRRRKRDGSRERRPGYSGRGRPDSEGGRPSLWTRPSSRPTARSMMSLGLLADGHRSWAPVVADDRLAGVLSARDAVSAYRRALSSNVHQVRLVGSSGTLLEAEIGAGSALAGKRVSEAAWPRDSVLVSVARGERVIVPRGHVVLEAGDRLTVFTVPAAREALESLLSGHVVPGAQEP